MLELPPIEAVVEALHLEPHPEGGYYARTYAAELQLPWNLLPAGFGGPRHVATMIYYLLPRGGRSRLHRIQSDETWHIYLGGPIHLVQLDETGTAATETALGPNILAGERPQAVVPAGRWFGSYMPSDSAAPYTLCGCTVSPGFDFAEFELADPAAAWPDDVRHLVD